MRLFASPIERILVRKALWTELLSELAGRGRGERESGAFLLARPGSRRVDEIIYFDDLDPDCLVGSIDLSASAFSRLWDHCALKSRTVIADVHTHPYSNVAQSVIDRDNPTIAVAGHVSLIVPNFAVRELTRRQVGVHLYCGDRGWVSYFGRSAWRRIKLER